MGKRSEKWSNSSLSRAQKSKKKSNCFCVAKKAPTTKLAFHYTALLILIKEIPNFHFNEIKVHLNEKKPNHTYREHMARSQQANLRLKIKEKFLKTNFPINTNNKTNEIFVTNDIETFHSNETISRKIHIEREIFTSSFLYTNTHKHTYRYRKQY